MYHRIRVFTMFNAWVSLSLFTHGLTYRDRHCRNISIVLNYMCENCTLCVRAGQKPSQVYTLQYHNAQAAIHSFSQWLLKMLDLPHYDLSQWWTKTNFEAVTWKEIGDKNWWYFYALFDHTFDEALWVNSVSSAQ